MRQVIYTNGHTEELQSKVQWPSVKALVCEHENSLVQVVHLQHWPEDLGPDPKVPHMMCLDENGATDFHPGYPLPTNPVASRIYWAQCVAGTTWPIRGTVYICPQGDYE